MSSALPPQAPAAYVQKSAIRLEGTGLSVAPTQP